MELALGIIKGSKRRFFEDDRNKIIRELHHAKRGVVLYEMAMVGGSTVSWNYNPAFDAPDPHRDTLLLLIRSIELAHSKGAYSHQRWQHNGRKKEYKRSAKNHYS